MNKNHLIEFVSDATELNHADAGRVVAAFITTIVDSVAAGDEVTLAGFGSFRAQQRTARTGTNPQNGERLKIAAATVPKFVASSSFKATVARPERR